MSSILFSNPFVAPTLPPNPPHETTSALAVAPTQGTSAGKSADNATSFSGSGSGHSDGNGQHTAASSLRKRAHTNMSRPTNATSTSVVEAQTYGDAKVMAFGENLPEVAMPDPLPTSPYLKRS